MEVLTIGKSKMKILLSEAEAKKYGLKIEDECRDTAESRRILWQIFETAREKRGIDPSGDKLLVQFYPLKDGSLELFVTKLGLLPISSRRYVTDSDRVTVISRKKAYYLFECEESLSYTLRSLKAGCGREGVSGAVYRGAGGYVLELYEFGREDCEFPHIAEFAERLPSETGYFLGEYFEKICEANELLAE